MTKNEQVCLWLGLNPACHNLESDPGKVQLLREITRQGLRKRFINSLVRSGGWSISDMLFDLFEDKTGKLLKAAYEFLKEEKNNG